MEQPDHQLKKALFPRLKPGPRSIPATRAAAHQKARLQAAMVELAAQEGFAATTVEGLVGLAGVSKSTFYAHFEGKQDCFLQTFDEIVRQVSEQVGEAYRRPGDFRAKLVTATSVFMELVVQEPAAARLVTIESLALGTAGVAHRERAAEAFELMVRQSFDHSRSDVRVTDVAVRGIVAGFRGVVYRHLRANQYEALPEIVEDLVDWALAYQRRPSPAAERAIRAAARGPEHSRAVDHEQPGAEIPWEESPSSVRSRTGLSQRERIRRAAARLVVERGFAALSIPAISAEAGVSNQTFYENFASKRDAFLAAVEQIAGEVLRACEIAFRAAEERPEAVGAAVRTLTDYFAERELFAQLAFFELPTAGPAALDRADEIFNRFASILRSGSTEDSFGAPPPDQIMPAIISAVWAVIQHEIANGRRVALPKLATEITMILVAPFNRA